MECGPSNPLAQLSKAYGRDQHLFRQSPADSARDSDANAFAFFAHRIADDAFSLSQLHESLDESAPARIESSDWANSFTSSSAAFGPLTSPAQLARFERAFTTYLYTPLPEGAVFEPPRPDLARHEQLMPPAARSWEGHGIQWLQWPSTTDGRPAQAAHDWDAAFAQHTSRPNHSPPILTLQESNRVHTTRLHSLPSSPPSAAIDNSSSTPSAPSSTLSYDSDAESPALPPQSALELYKIGIQHQISEREPLAIAALVQAVSLDATLAEAHLALAMSYGNEHRRDDSYSSLEYWVECLAGGRYHEYLSSWRDVMRERERDEGVEGRHDVLMEVLMELAAIGAKESARGVDPEVQIALGLLFTLNSDFVKAEDCFEAALGQLPDDPLLWNRLAVTLTNGGKPKRALQFYEAALDLHPGYIRCRVNLAVAHANLGRFADAVEHLVVALTLQEAELELDGEGHLRSGVTSYPLWEALNNALHMMGRSDLASLTLSMDLDALRRIVLADSA